MQSDLFAYVIIFIHTINNSGGGSIKLRRKNRVCIERVKGWSNAFVARIKISVWINKYLLTLCDSSRYPLQDDFFCNFWSFLEKSTHSMEMVRSRLQVGRASNYLTRPDYSLLLNWRHVSSIRQDNFLKLFRVMIWQLNQHQWNSQCCIEIVSYSLRTNAV